MQTERATAKPKKRVKVRRTPAPSGVGPVAPKPQGVFAQPIKAPSVRDQPSPRPKVRKRPAAVLDILPAAKGQPAKPYTPPVAKTVVRKAKRVREQVQHETRDTKGADDRARADAYLRDHPEILDPKEERKGGSLIATITGASTAAKIAAAANPIGALNLLTKGSVAKTIKNVPKDTAEIITTTPTSLVALGDTAIHDPEKVPGMLLAPYKELIKHPGKTITEHPVSTALMVAPAARVPGRAAGRVARATGKQTLARPAATLPGSVLKEKRVASKDAVVNVIQKRRDSKQPAPELTVARGNVKRRSDLERRADEYYEFGQQKTQQIQGGALKTAKQAHAGLPRPQRKAAIAADVDAARAGAGKTIDQRFVKEFGSPWQRLSSGMIVKPKQATEGHLHSTKAEADAVAAALNASPKITAEFKVMAAGQKFGVVPKVAADRLATHRSIGSSKATGAILLRRGRQNLTQATLPTSPKWLGGQAGEAGIRAAIAGAGPADWLRMNKVVKEMNRTRPGSGDDFLMRIEGDHSGLIREYAQGTRTLAADLAHTDLAAPAAGATKLAALPPVRAVRAGWRKYSEFVLGTVNGAIERNTRKAIAGHHVQQQILNNRILSLSDEAIQDAARGLKSTEAQLHLARALDRDYGKYSKFTPDQRQKIMHWTPYIPWYLNTVHFLSTVLPKDHPVMAALVADAGMATEQWRKDHGLSLYGDDVKPEWMLGTYPTKRGLLPVNKLAGPFGLGQDPAGGIANTFLPQIIGPVLNLGVGVDWKGDKLKHQGYDGKPFNMGEKIIRALVTEVEAQVPLAAPAARISGLENKINHKKSTVTRAQRIERQWNPLAPIPHTNEAQGEEMVQPVRRQSRRVLPPPPRAVRARRLPPPPPPPRSR